MALSEADRRQLAAGGSDRRRGLGIADMRRNTVPAVRVFQILRHTFAAFIETA
ncbi:MAG: hypothetical protein ACK56I_02510 [bacterium]